MPEIIVDGVDLQAVHDLLVSVAHKAGDMITAATPVSGATGIKKNSADLVTETDQAVEAMVSSTLLSAFPNIKFMGEETHTADNPLTAAPTFICDPIDGTTNFVHRHSAVCISLGLAIAYTPVVGVIYNPFTRILHTAIRGHGAHRFTDNWSGNAALTHGRRLPLQEPAPMRDLSTCLVAVEWGSDRGSADFEVRAATFRKLTQSKEKGGAMVQGLRSLGSAAINLCEVAAGSLDVYWEAGCWAWDVCAGVAILNEAGGLFVDANPGNWEPRIDDRRHLAVRGGEGQREIVKEFWDNIVGEFEVNRHTPAK